MSWTSRPVLNLRGTSAPLTGLDTRSWQGLRYFNGAGSSLLALSEPGATTVPAIAQADAPLFRDPIHGGATDPVVVYHRAAGEWCVLYSAATSPRGATIGIATSSTGGRSWEYRGAPKGLDTVHSGRNSFWAPEVIWHGGTYHLYVSHVAGTRAARATRGHILHYTSQDLLNWRFDRELELSGEGCADAAVWPLPDGQTWRMWYTVPDGSVHAADSTDLSTWLPVSRSVCPPGQGAPSVFRFVGYYWMITSGDRGLPVYRSNDLRTWFPQSEPLLAQPGIRLGDNAPGHHGSVLTQGERAHILYSCRFGQASCLQLASLAVVDGKLTADRDAPSEVDWRPQSTVELRGGQRAT